MKRLIAVNAGGPYGSSQLKGVQADSDRVLAGVLGGSAGRADWRRALIAIEPAEGQPWHVRAAAATSASSAYAFETR